MIVLLTEHHLELLSLKGGCTGSSETIYVNMPHCWKSHVTAHKLCNQNHYLMGRGICSLFRLCVSSGLFFLFSHAHIYQLFRDILLFTSNLRCEVTMISTRQLY